MGTKRKKPHRLLFSADFFLNAWLCGQSTEKGTCCLNSCVHVDFPCVPERPDRCTAHSRSPNSLWHSAENSDILSYLLCAATIYIPQKNLSSNRSPTSLPSTRPWPRVRAQPASRIFLLEMEATTLAAFHRRGVFAGLSADQRERAIVHGSGPRVGLLGPESSCLSCYFSSALIWNSLKRGRPVFPLGEVSVIMISLCSFEFRKREKHSCSFKWQPGIESFYAFHLLHC